jgi:aspartate-semialdehyde dehydrogenase
MDILKMKLVRETKKILSDNTIAVTATAVRVLVGGHSEALNVEFTKDFDVNEVRSILQETDGIIVQDNLKEFEYPMPMYAEGKTKYL